MRRILSDLGALIALSVDYASTFAIGVIFNWPTADTELFIHILLLLVISFLFGALIVDLKKALFIMGTSLAIGVFLATFIISTPSILLAENIVSIDLSLTVALTSVSQLIITGITFVLMGLVAGCFIGDSLTE